MKTKEQQEAVRARLADLMAEHDGVLTPEIVVADAAKKDSPLHDEFEWNGKKAAHHWRIEQARALIRSVRVVITTQRTTVSTVAYIRNPQAEPAEQGYVAVSDIRSDRELSRAALVAEFARAAATLRRARELAVAFDMSGEIDVLVAEIDTLRTKVTGDVQQRSAA